MARQSAAVDTPQQSGFVELAQITPHGVRGHVELRGQVGGEHASLRAKPVKDQGTSLFGQHLPKLTRLCPFIPERA